MRRFPAFRLALAALFVLAARPAPAAVPPLYVPQHADTLEAESEPAPLLIPGRPNPSDSLRVSSGTRGRKAYVLGRALERQGQPASAIAAYRNAVKLDPTLRDAHFRMGLLFARVGQHRAAAHEFEAEMRVDPANLEAARGLAMALSQAGDSTRAIAQLERLTRLNPRDEPSWQALGFAYTNAGRLADGERALRRALALDPRDADAWRDLGVVLAARGHETESARSYRRALALAPRDATAMVNLANLERRANRLESALALYRQAADRDSLQGFAYRGQISVLRALGRDAEAGAVYRRMLQLDPLDQPTRVEAMQYFDAMGRRDIALELGRDGVRADPKSGEAHLALGMAYHAAGDPVSALAELRRAESGMRLPEQRARVGALLRALRADAPDSLRALYAADSVAHVHPTARDSAAARRR